LLIDIIPGGSVTSVINNYKIILYLQKPKKTTIMKNTSNIQKSGNRTVIFSFVLVFSIVFFTGIVDCIAQSPDFFNYQAVVRDADGNPLKEQAVKLKINILKGAFDGNTPYSEEHNVTSNALGLVNLKIGNGTALSGNIDTIHWGETDYFLQIELDADGGGYHAMGTQQLVSVPYAKHAATAGKLIEPVTQNGDTLFLPGGEYTVIQGLGENMRGIMKDPRDGQIYQTVKINGDWWMAENLNFYTDTGSVYYDNDSAKYAVPHGRLYSWYMAMNGDAPSDANPSGVQGICPPGWHIPSMVEWFEIIDLYGGKGNSIEKFKETGPLYWGNDNDGTNISGLSVIPSGEADSDFYFYGFGDHINVLSSELLIGTGEPGSESSYIEFNSEYIGDFHTFIDEYFYIRCKKD